MDIIEILTWAIPTGGVGAAIGWLANHKANRAKADKEAHDAYKAMYHDLAEELRTMRTDNAELRKQMDDVSAESSRLRRTVNRLSRAVESIQSCPYREQCPIRNELTTEN